MFLYKSYYEKKLKKCKFLVVFCPLSTLGRSVCPCKNADEVFRSITFEPAFRACKPDKTFANKVLKRVNFQYLIFKFDLLILQTRDSNTGTRFHPYCPFLRA